jgi:hypothetical protein
MMEAFCRTGLRRTISPTSARGKEKGEGETSRGNISHKKAQEAQKENRSNNLAGIIFRSRGKIR